MQPPQKKEAQLINELSAPGAESSASRGSAGVSCRILWLMVGVCLVLSVLRGIQLPLPWTTAYYCVTYSLGIVSRGLVGAFFSLTFGSLWFNYKIIAFAMYAVWGLSIAFALATVGRIAKTHAVILGAALVYVSSPACTLYHNSIGYPEHLAVIVVCALLFLSWRISSKAWLVVITLSTLVTLALIHEVLVFLWAPVLFWNLVDGLSRGREISSRRMLSGAAVVFGGAALILLGLAHFGVLSPVERDLLYQRAVDRADFPVSARFFTELSGSIAQFRPLMAAYWSKPSSWSALWFAASLAIPAFVILNVVGCKAVTQRASSALNRFVLLFVFELSLLTPMILLGFGLDVHRWLSGMVTSCFAITVVMSRHVRILDVPRAIRALILPVVCVNLSSANILFGPPQSLYPFFDRIEYIYQVVKGDRPLIPTQSKSIPPRANVRRFSALSHPSVGIHSFRSS
jgi:hypothetical protein